MEELAERLSALLEQCPPLHAIRIASNDAPETALTIFYKDWDYVILIAPGDVAQKETFGAFVKAHKGLVFDEQGDGTTFDFGASDAEPSAIIRDGVAAAYGQEAKIRVSGPSSYVTTTVEYQPETGN